jgi:hypothetical protein
LGVWDVTSTLMSVELPEGETPIFAAAAAAAAGAAAGWVCGTSPAR